MKRATKMLQKLARRRQIITQCRLSLYMSSWEAMDPVNSSGQAMEAEVKAVLESRQKLCREDITASMKAYVQALVCWDQVSGMFWLGPLRQHIRPF